MTTSTMAVPSPVDDERGSRPSRRIGMGAAPISQAGQDMLADAQRVLGLAIGARQPAERYAQSHLAALRGAAAVLAARALPRRSRRGSAWELLARLAPELAEWSAFFAAGARRRQAIAAGVQVAMPQREADDMVRAAAEFLELVDGVLRTRRGR